MEHEFEKNYNYRIVRYKMTDGEVVFGVHKVFYDDAGKITGWIRAPLVCKDLPQKDLDALAEAFQYSDDNEGIIDSDALPPESALNAER